MGGDSSFWIQVSNKGEVECLIANTTDADLWIQVWDKVNGHREQDLRLGVAWEKAHTSAKEKAQMTQESKQTAMAHEKADELAEGGATLDGAEFSEQVATGADKVRKRISCCN